MHHRHVSVTEFICVMKLVAVHRAFVVVDCVFYDPEIIVYLPRFCLVDGVREGDGNPPVVGWGLYRSAGLVLSVS